MARGRKKVIPNLEVKKETVKEAVKEVKKPVSGWTRTAVILKGLITPYRIPGKIGDTKEIPNHLVEELVQSKKIKLL